MPGRLYKLSMFDHESIFSADQLKWWFELRSELLPLEFTWTVFWGFFFRNFEAVCSRKNSVLGVMFCETHVKNKQYLLLTSAQREFNKKPQFVRNGSLLSLMFATWRRCSHGNTTINAPLSTWNLVWLHASMHLLVKCRELCKKSPIFEFYSMSILVQFSL